MEGRNDDDCRRPQDVSPYYRWKLMNTTQRKAWWGDYRQGKHKSSSSDATGMSGCPMGLHSLLAGSLAEVLGIQHGLLCRVLLFVTIAATKG